MNTFVVIIILILGIVSLLIKFISNLDRKRLLNELWCEWVKAREERMRFQTELSRKFAVNSLDEERYLELVAIELGTLELYLMHCTKPSESSQVGSQNYYMLLLEKLP